MKKLIIISIALLSFGLTPVFAQAPTGVASKAAARQDTIISRLKTRADNEITRRLDALTKLISRIGDMKKISTDQKTALTADVQGQIDAMNTLKTKIDADTDLATLRTDVQSIVKSYRIFALFIPKTYIMARADRLLEVIDLLTGIQEKLQTRIDALKTGGTDTTAMQKLITDMASKLGDAKTQITNALTAITPLTPDGFPANKTTLQSARAMLVTARRDIQTAHADEQQIRQALVKAGVKVNAKITPVGATPTP